ncbi:hypothetical protein STCU_03616 [Strigomonas culicis]|uniref:Glycosomal membrane protein n=1 Tax=Strigomonas culicis TaxID=28005 RepID=S9UQK3_9TRYP|nr:hypothetical protein STCU_03616 [Strigomonas culicis]|eukprot:EPY31113.1 hypothetical protein STCU_03616 [Strigomonas culicis]
MEQLQNFPALFAEYHKKGVGVDMVLKSFLGIFRLCKLYSRKEEDVNRFAHIADSIVECRMLCNYGRPTMTLVQGFRMYKEKGNMAASALWLFQTLSLFLRVPEQISGDLGYMQKVVFSNWSRQTFSFFYRFFKSLSLTCCLAADIERHRQLCAIRGASHCAKELALIRKELAHVRLMTLRTICDMYVYYKWIPRYTPIPTLEYICGMISGMIGVFMVWSDVVEKASGTGAKDCPPKAIQEKDVTTSAAAANGKKKLPAPIPCDPGIPHVCDISCELEGGEGGGE